MSELFVNVIAYKSQFIEALITTVQMFVLSGVWIIVFGFVFGIVLTVCHEDGIHPRKGLYSVVNIAVNVFRSIPFIILLIFLIPFTRFVMQTAIGVKGAIIPLVIGTVPFYARQVESALVNVDKGKIEAARAMGSGTLGIIFRIYLKEAVPELIRGTTITAISLLNLTTMAGAVGAGGIGSFAINYGQSLHHQDIVNVCVVILLLVVSIIQTLGTTLARSTTNKSLFTHYIHFDK